MISDKKHIFTWREMKISIDLPWSGRARKDEVARGEEGSAILAEDYVELSPEQGRAPVTLNFSLDFLISR